jgi:hypothetical protein
VQRNVAGGETTTFAVRQDDAVEDHGVQGPAFAGSNQDRQRLESRDFGEPELTSRWFRGRSGRRLDGFGLRDRVFRERRPAAGEEQRNKDKSLHATLPAQCQRRRPATKTTNRF